MALLRRISLPVLILALAATPAVAQADPVLEYFNIPGSHNSGAGIATAPDGTVWFGANGPFNDPGLGRLIPSQAVAGTSNGVSTFPLSKSPLQCCASMTRSVAFDGTRNRVLFVQSDGLIGRADPAAVQAGTSAGIASQQVSTTLTAGGTWIPDLWDIAVGANGPAWFTERSAYNLPPYPGARIAMFDDGTIGESEGIATQTGSFVGPRYDSKPSGIAVDADGTPWFAESEAGNPGYRIARGSGKGYVEYLISPPSGVSSGTGPTDVAVAADGAIWFTNELNNSIGRLSPDRTTFTHYALTAIDAKLAGGRPRAITAAPDGTLWVAEYGGFSLANANALIRVVPDAKAPTATVYHVGAGRFPMAVAPDGRGGVWFAMATASAPGQIGRLVEATDPIGPTDPTDPGDPEKPAPPPGGGSSSDGGAATTTPAPGEKALVATAVGAAKVGDPRTEGAAISLDQICVGPPADPCILIYIISAHEYVNGFPNTVKGSAAAAGKKRGKGKATPKAVVYGKKTVTLHGGDKRTITISLNRAGKKLLKTKGRVTLHFTATQKGADGKPATRVKAKKVTFKQPKPKK